MIYYKLVKITFNAAGLAEVIIDVIVHHHTLLNLIVTNRSSFFTSKFWSLLCYFLGIKRRLSTAFHPQTDSQIEWQINTREACLWALVNFKQNDWARLLPMAEFAYNNAKNSSTGHTPFELNCSYHCCVSFKENTNSLLPIKISRRVIRGTTRSDDYLPGALPPHSRASKASSW